MLLLSQEINKYLYKNAYKFNNDLFNEIDKLTCVHNNKNKNT